MPPASKNAAMYAAVVSAFVALGIGAAWMGCDPPEILENTIKGLCKSWVPATAFYGPLVWLFLLVLIVFTQRTMFTLGWVVVMAILILSLWWIFLHFNRCDPPEAPSFVDTLRLPFLCRKDAQEWLPIAVPIYALVVFLFLIFLSLKIKNTKLVLKRTSGI